jgi:hypothetical protein
MHGYGEINKQQTKQNRAGLLHAAAHKDIISPCPQQNKRAHKHTSREGHSLPPHAFMAINGSLLFLKAIRVLFVDLSS